MKRIITFILLMPTIMFANCNENIKLQVLGSGGPELNDKRASSSYLLYHNNKAIIMIDSGSGSALNFEKSTANFNDIKAILFTHLHVDHTSDLPTFIKASYFTNRSENLKIFGPMGNDFMPSTSKFISSLFSKDGAYRYLNEYYSKDYKSDYKIIPIDVPISKKIIYKYQINKDIKISATPVHHGPISAIAWNVEISSCKITFSGDISNSFKTLKNLAINSDILVATNAIPQSSEGAARFLHMPPSEIGKIAKNANVKKLILSHRMNRTLGKEENIKQIIKKQYNGKIKFANDMDIFEF